MIFSSTIFLLYFLPAFFGIYYITPEKFKNWLIVLASVVFYMWGAPKFIMVLAGTIVLDFFLAIQIAKLEQRAKKSLLILSVTINVGLLLYFKYFNFFIDNLQALGLTDISFARIALPIGISFFTFHELSYIIDVYRGVKPPMKKIVDYAVYILLFPQLIAGPIIRFNEIADQIKSRTQNNWVSNCYNGLFRFSIGLAKKLFIANLLGKQVDEIFKLLDYQMDFLLAWTGILAYTFQIYFDFSGYSDMAIGLAKMMGFTFPENFNMPYIAQSITDFWSRWHISLSRWMRDYLYIPLGGNQVAAWRRYINLWLVFLISGLWHGAQWNFIIWGVYHGLFLTLDKLILQKALNKINGRISMIIAFFIVVIGWVFFRSENLTHSIMFIKKLFDFNSNPYYNPLGLKFYFVFGIAILLSFLPMIEMVRELSVRLFFETHEVRYQLLKTAAMVILLLLCIIEVTSADFNPFIYFRF